MFFYETFNARIQVRKYEVGKYVNRQISHQRRDGNGSLGRVTMYGNSIEHIQVGKAQPFLA